MNRINKVLAQAEKSEGKEKLLSIYFTAGFPRLEDTVTVLEQLQESGVDMVEIGLPFSDPLADGPTIQKSSTKALQNGMTTDILFEQLKNARDKIEIPLLIMGYFNPMMQYGIEEFCRKCRETGIDGLIIPDLPVDVYHSEYKDTFERYGLINVFLITPQTSDERIRFIDEISDGFIYMVSSASTTGAKNSFGTEQNEYFKRIEQMSLKSPQIVGFGISNRETFDEATRRSAGAIIGSAFVKFLEEHGVKQIPAFVESIR
jgi:tryptophan synthase alpha chain